MKLGLRRFVEIDYNSLMSGTSDISQAELIALISELRAEVARLQKRVDELEGKNPTQKLNEAYSVSAEERRREASGHKKRKKQKSDRRGRIPTSEKTEDPDRSEIVLPDGFSKDECSFIRKRPVWRIENGKAVRVVYEIFIGPGGQRPQIEGVLARCEFGIEIHVAVAFLTFIAGLSIDKVCAAVNFFWKLDLSKSQADAMLNQLSKQWADEFESLCELLAVSAVVHTDETSWSINSVWAFLSDKVRLMLFGCRKDGQTLAKLLSKTEFNGILVSDDASVYRNFKTSQKCWAHLLRKAIRLTLLDPECDRYREFLDGLLHVFRTAKRFSSDKRLGEKARLERVDELSNLLCDLCGDRFSDESAATSDTEKDFFNLVHELVRLMGDDELFTFVIHPEVDATNNAAERGLRSPAMDRRTGRTSKTVSGARRRTILVSVLESLRLHLPEFTHRSVQAEVMSWLSKGESLFDRLLRSSGLAPPKTPKLKTLIPE